RDLLPAEPARSEGCGEVFVDFVRSMSEASTLPPFAASAGDGFILSAGTRSPGAVGAPNRPRFGFAASVGVLRLVVPLVDRKAIMPTPKTRITPIATSISGMLPR